MSKLSLLINTLKYMKPEQLCYQLKGRRVTKCRIPRLSMVAMKYKPHLFVPELDADPAVVGRFLPAAILDDEVRILNQARKVDLRRMEVMEGDVTPLWHFNLLYCEYAVALMVKAQEENDRRYLDKAKEIFMGAAKKFEEKGMGRSPYVLSLQVVNLLIASDQMEVFKDGMEKREERFFHADLYRKYLFLKNHRDRHLGANHYIENLKALLILAICYDEQGDVKTYLAELQRELDEQILPDGMHYERSFMYHKLILEDLLRIVLAAQGTPWEEEVRDALRPYIRRMSIVTDRMEGGLPRTPLFNDSADNVAKPAEDLLRAAVRLGLAEGADPGEGYTFPHAGYYRMNRPGFSLVVGAAEVGPSYNPGHNHNDCLSFEVFAGQTPVFVNSGCYSYFGPTRGYARSVAAHNTFKVDGTEHSECWASHRVARRLSDVRMSMDREGFTGSFKDYKGHTCSRTIEYGGDVMSVTDHCPDEGKHEITSYLHVGPKFNVTRSDDGRFFVCGDRGQAFFSIIVEEGSAELLSKSPDFPYSPEFGLLCEVDVLVMRGERVRYRIEEA